MSGKNKAIIVNIEKCLACKSCEIACAVAHSRAGVLAEAIKEEPTPQKRVMVEAAEEFAVPMQCRHCEDAPCITVCPTAAIYRLKADEPVLIEQDKCIGCKFCLIVCPFGVINVSRDGKAVTKCDLCIMLTEAGREPACVESCPTGALKLCEIQEWTNQRRQKAAKKATADLTAQGKNASETEDESEKS